MTASDKVRQADDNVRQRLGDHVIYAITFALALLAIGYGLVHGCAGGFDGRLP